MRPTVEADQSCSSDVVVSSSHDGELKKDSDRSSQRSFYDDLKIDTRPAEQEETHKVGLAEANIEPEKLCDQQYTKPNDEELLATDHRLSSSTSQEVTTALYCKKLH